MLKASICTPHSLKMGQEINKLKCTRKLSFQVSVENNLKVKINLGASDSHATGILKNKINKKKSWCGFGLALGE